MSPSREDACRLDGRFILMIAESEPVSVDGLPNFAEPRSESCYDACPGVGRHWTDCHSLHRAPSRPSGVRDPARPRAGRSQCVDLCRVREISEHLQEPELRHRVVPSIHPRQPFSHLWLADRVSSLRLCDEAPSRQRRSNSEYRTGGSASAEGVGGRAPILDRHVLLYGCAGRLFSRGRVPRAPLPLEAPLKCVRTDLLL